MKIELLYMDRCPHWRDTMKDIHAVLEDHQLTTEVELVKVNSQQEADGLAFPGSPTVRVDGVDVEPDAPTSGFGLECRIYQAEDEPQPQARPPKEWIAAAVEAAIG